ncbi:MAG: hypothetical protein DESF_01391 [Desulfovibrio sp.]
MRTYWKYLNIHPSRTSESSVKVKAVPWRHPLLVAGGTRKGSSYVA